MPGWINIDLAEVALNMRQCQQAFVHNPVPKPGYIGDQVAAKITIWQLGDVIEVTQALVTAGSVGMMI